MWATSARARTPPRARRASVPPPLRLRRQIASCDPPPHPLAHPPQLSRAARVPLRRTSPQGGQPEDDDEVEDLDADVAPSPGAVNGLVGRKVRVMVKSKWRVGEITKALKGRHAIRWDDGADGVEAANMSAQIAKRVLGVPKSSISLCDGAPDWRAMQESIEKSILKKVLVQVNRIMDEKIVV